MWFRRLKRWARERLFRFLEGHLNADHWADHFYELARRLENKRLRAFIRETDFSALDVSKYPVRYISSGTLKYQMFNMMFCREMQMFAVYCLYKRTLPRMDVNLCGGGYNLWERYLEQPYPSEDARLASRESWGYCCKITHMIDFPQFPTQEDVLLFAKLYRPPLFQLKEETRKYIEGEYEEIFVKRGNPRVCGVLCRGTDFYGAKNHPTQPAIPDMIEFISAKMAELNCEYIYLATEEYRIQKLFDEAFPGKVLINRRQYCDGFWEKRAELGDLARVGMVHGEREDDAYYRGLEYLSSIALLSRCRALIAGACGGSCAALYMNGGKYEYWHLFNLGLNKEGVSYGAV